ncbi:MAG: DUF1634 domain-containing protein [Deltaproteobacteria bacterium]|nr:DUF1634 domain-containing protein [Deltaproteobacteria bacterium]
MGGWGDDRVQRVIGKLLRWGVVAAAALAMAGGAMYLVDCGGAIPDYGVFRGEPPELTEVAAIAREAFSLNPLGLIQFGLLLLIATPLARIVFSVAAFALQRDLAYVAVTLAVLVVVLLGLAREGPGTVVPPDRFRPMCASPGASLRISPLMDARQVAGSSRTTFRPPSGSLEARTVPP